MFNQGQSLQLAQDLFFPERKSKLGKDENVTLSLLDYQENCMEAAQKLPLFLWP